MDKFIVSGGADKTTIASLSARSAICELNCPQFQNTLSSNNQDC
jgi:hypothetical protein